MTPDEFRQHGREVIDWIADYMETVEKRPVASQVSPGDIRKHLPASAPDAGEDFRQIIKDVDEILMPGITHWQSPNFFAYYPANASGASILGELMSAGLGVQGMSWVTSPACTELESHVLDWLVPMLGLPDKFLSSTDGGGVIQDSASSATLCALLAARERATNFESNRTGKFDRLVAYASEEAHSSVEKAMMISGVGEASLRRIPTDPSLRMATDALAKQMKSDHDLGYTPFFVVATSGTTSTGAIDPVAKIAETCKSYRAWLHVDAAMAGTAAACPEFRSVHNGVEFADSYCFNPHKWMLVNFDCDCFYVADRADLIRALSVLPEYLKNQATESGAVIDYRDWQIPLGRRFRALKLWFVLRHFGVVGLQQRIRAHVELAAQFERWVHDSIDFQLAAPRVLNLVCFRHRAGDAVNERLLRRLNQSGKIFLTHTRVDDQFTLRMSIGQAKTELRHLELAWELIQELA